MQRVAHFEDLRSAYDNSFERLRGEIRNLKLAEQRVREAELAYRLKRDELAQFILDQQRETVDDEQLEQVAS